MSQAWTRGPICGVDNCQSRHYRMTDGLTICRYGHVMEGEFEFNDEEDQPIVAQTRRIAGVAVDARGVLTTTAPSVSKHASKSKKLYGKAAKDYYFKCLQILLKKLTSSMVDTYFPESSRQDLTNLVKTNWVKVLSVYFEESESVQNPIHRELSILDLISIIYISVTQLRYHPLYIHEVLEGIKTGAIPYIKCLHLIPKHMLDVLPSSYHNQLQPYKLPLYNLLYEHISTNVSRIRGKQSLQVPVNYYYTFILRIMSETLILPHSLDLFCMLVKLTKHLGVTHMELANYYKHTHKFPEIQLLGMVVFVTKLSFSLSSSKEVFKSKVTVGTWLRNLEQYELNNECTSAYLNLDYNELLDWSNEKIDKYCDWIHDNILPLSNRQDAEQEDLPVTSKRLFQIFAIEGEEEVSAKRVKLDSGQHDDPVELSIGVVLEKMAKEEDLESPILPISDLEDKLYSKLTTLFGITTEVLLRSYNDFEKQIRSKGYKVSSSS